MSPPAEVVVDMSAVVLLPRAAYRVNGVLAGMVLATPKTPAEAGREPICLGADGEIGVVDSADGDEVRVVGPRAGVQQGLDAVGLGVDHGNGLAVGGHS